MNFQRQISPNESNCRTIEIRSFAYFIYLFLACENFLSLFTLGIFTFAKCRFALPFSIAYRWQRCAKTRRWTNKRIFFFRYFLCRSLFQGVCKLVLQSFVILIHRKYFETDSWHCIGCDTFADALFNSTNIRHRIHLRWRRNVSGKKTEHLICVTRVRTTNAIRNNVRNWRRRKLIISNDDETTKWIREKLSKFKVTQCKANCRRKICHLFRYTMYKTGKKRKNFQLTFTFRRISLNCRKSKRESTKKISQIPCLHRRLSCRFRYFFYFSSVLRLHWKITKERWVDFCSWRNQRRKKLTISLSFRLSCKTCSLQVRNANVKYKKLCCRRDMRRN